MRLMTITVGTGPSKILALHGWFGSGKDWGGLPDLIDGAHFTYAFPDYRGYGTRRDEPGEYTIAEAAADMLAVADTLGWDRFSLLGHSMGGIVAQQILANAPARVECLAGISPVPATGVPFDEHVEQVVFERFALVWPPDRAPGGGPG